VRDDPSLGLLRNRRRRFDGARFRFGLALVADHVPRGGAHASMVIRIP
jgi:hypothetical protein